MTAPPLKRRLASLLYEALVVVALVLVVAALFSFASMAAPSLARRPLLLAVCFLTWGAYFIYCWCNGQTLAMRAWKLRIVDASGRAMSPGRACLRYVCAWVWVVPPLAAVSATGLREASFTATLGTDAAAVLAWMALWSAASFARADRQFWHDAAAGTRIVAA